MAGTRRGFGQTERRKNARTGKTTGWRARYLGPDKLRYSQTFTTKLDAEHWLHSEESLIARGEWIPPGQRVARVTVTLNEYVAANMKVRKLAPRTREEYETYVERFLIHDELRQEAAEGDLRARRHRLVLHAGGHRLTGLLLQPGVLEEQPDLVELVLQLPMEVSES